MTDGPIEHLLLEGLRSGQIGGDPETHRLQAMGFIAFGGGDRFGGHIVDLGSGVGLPALVLAAACPHSRWTLIERRTGRADLLRRAVARLGWTDRVEVLARDAGVVARSSLRATADWVTARGFGPPAVTAEFAAPFLRGGGSVLTSEPRDASIEERWPDDGLALVGLELAERWRTDAGSYVRLVRVDGGEIDRLPRTGARKRPLF